MKILIITASLKPTSGIGRYSREVVDGLIRNGIDVSVAAYSASEVSYPVIIFEQSRSILSFIGNILKLRRLARGVDIVHSLDVWPYGVYGYLAVLGTKKRFFVNGVGTYSLMSHVSRFKKVLMRGVYRRAERVFCVSHYMRDLIAVDVAHSHFTIAYLGFTPLPDISLPVRTEFELTYGLKKHFPVILTVGGIKSRKGQFDVLQSLVPLKQKYPTILYCMVSVDTGAEYLAEMEAFAESNNLTHNMRIISDAHTDEALTYLYSTCDVYALTSIAEAGHVEGFGLSLVEANQFGKPTIGTRRSGTQEAVQNGYSGYLVDPKSPAHIAEKIEHILTEGPETFIVHAKEFASRFTWEKTVQIYIAAYTRLSDY